MGNEIEIGQVHEPKTIIFGNVQVYNAVKEGLKTDEKGNQIYCVWIGDVEKGVYVEYPTQNDKQIDTYTAREYGGKVHHFITKETYEKNQTHIDDKNYKFEKFTDYPTIFLEKTSNAFGPLYNGTVNGVNGIKYTGSKTERDVVTFYNTQNGDVYMDNDNKADGVNVGVDCGTITPHMTKGLDSMSGFKGYVKGGGYFNKFEKIF